MIKAILMDFNGVIINDEPIQMRAYQEILKEEGIDLTEDAYLASLGMDDTTFIEAAYERAGETPGTNKVLEIAIAKTNRWRELIADELPLFPGIENFVRKMAQEFALGIVSMAKREEIQHVLEVSGLGDCFSIIVSAEDVTKCKPDPECYRIGFRRLDLARTHAGHLPMTHRDCLVIEDAPPGIIAAKTADLKTLAVTNTVSAEAMRNAGADAIATNLDDWMPDSMRRVFV
jgi:HAD superfamily hydrolase (TIGR01509 family)